MKSMFGVSIADSVLVLNANFEPINVCSLRRALGLMFSNRASLVINGRGVIKTSYEEYPIPSVIRLQKMVRRPRQHVKLNRRELFRRDNYTCQYCGEQTKTLTIDHVIPRHLGGDSSWTNVVASCPACNHKKGGRLLKDVGMTLLRKPLPPPSSAMYIYGRYLVDNEDWQQFLIGW